jgi:glycine/D-amino acid oxidase-like deaminating enzyme
MKTTRVDVLLVGAGISGIGAAYHLLVELFWQGEQHGSHKQAYTE